MNLRPFISYYGGKWRSAKRYPEPVHDTIVEPFAGSAGYSVRYHTKRVILIDAYEPVAAVWEYLIHVKPEEILSLPDVPDGVSVDDMTGLTQEQRWLVGFWINSASASPCKRPSDWVRSTPVESRKGCYWGPKCRQRIAAQVPHIRHWRVIHGYYADAPDIEATWFVDPPYDNAAGSRYPMQIDDYKELGVWCQTIPRGQVIVCENSGADWLPFVDLFSNRSAPHNGKKHTHRTEAIWVRNDDPNEPDGDD